MLARGLSDTMKVLKIYFRLLDLLISLKILEILKARTTVVDYPREIDEM
jgi:hypothetical protein